MHRPTRILTVCAAALCCTLALSSRPARRRLSQAQRFPPILAVEVEHSAPKRIVVRSPGAINPVAYWYMTFTVTNNSTKSSASCRSSRCSPTTAPDPQR